ncbi:MAG: hypothetical protein HUJ58_01155 [Erysipelotrichaceae bacterium]|nr:hypothetical protein [Erysipelotrichaceae bacterium]
MKFKPDSYVACICEGASEQAIIEILLENHRLIFNRDQMIEEEVLRCRDARTFETRYLRKEYERPVTVVRILDSRREKFRLGKAYEQKVDVMNVITAPEIEMLIIINEQRYQEFKKSGKKPSVFCKQNLGMREVKSYRFVKEYFSDVDVLLEAIKAYTKISKIPKGEYTLSDILKKR